MKINPDDYLTSTQVGLALGAGPDPAAAKRAAARAMARAAEAGEEVRERILGRVVVHRKKLDVLKKYYFPRGSEECARMARLAGAKGGTQKALNRRLHEEYLARLSGAKKPHASRGTAGKEA